jgi:hypothetical protein
VLAEPSAGAAAPPAAVPDLLDAQPANSVAAIATQSHFNALTLRPLAADKTKEL